MDPQLVLASRQLSKSAATARRAALRAQEAVEARDEAIREAMAAGMHWQDVAKVTGLSQQRISQIMRQARQ
ncbi:hypothetical protein D7I44_01885 [Gryllotalpicola protaetiae]|uniref:Helix-turn-helix domain-containing protein n=2 Tax=Gryllotalpicola protaetiae TaxID=2419771 RepID=A0A387BI90_9MICO|nr:hypothetical protein D7I44_01885 [Gryllotalpicola protaetiae]